MTHSYLRQLAASVRDAFSLVSPLRALRLAALALAAGALSAAPEPVAAQSAQANANSKTFRWVVGRALVQPRAGLSEQELDKILRGHNARRVKHIRELNVYIVEMPPQADDVAAVRRLAGNRHLKFAQVDRALEPTLLPNDPYYANAWHLPKIGAPAAWDSSVGDGVTIAILDSGVDGTHPDLGPQMVPGWNFFDNNNVTADVYGHGTKVAGAASAASNNSTGVAAVSWRAKIMPIRITDTQGYGYDSMIAQGLVWAADRGARVANISFLGIAGSNTVLNAAQYMRNKGGVVVVAGGNTGGLVDYPATGLVTAVSATDGNDARASWSSYGPSISVAAPGVGIWTTTRGGGYAGFSGTSASSPVTAGTYALLIAAKPTLQPAALDDALFSTAVDLGSSGSDLYYGYGRIDAAAAVAKVKQATTTADTQPPTMSITNIPNGSTVNGLVAVDVAAADNVGVARVELYVDGAKIATDTAAPYLFTWDATARPDGPATLQARAYDAAGNVGTSSSVSVTVTDDTIPPTVAINSPTNGSVVSGTVSVSVSAADNKQVSKISLTIDGKEVAIAYGPSLSYSWNTGSTKKGKGGGKGGSTTTSSGGTSTLTARAQDAAGNAATASVTVTKQ